MCASREWTAESTPSHKDSVTANRQLIGKTNFLSQFRATLQKIVFRKIIKCRKLIGKVFILRFPSKGTIRDTRSLLWIHSVYDTRSALFDCSPVYTFASFRALVDRHLPALVDRCQVIRRVRGSAFSPVLGMQMDKRLSPVQNMKVFGKTLVPEMRTKVFGAVFV